jgi:hypothetical protein
MSRQRLIDTLSPHHWWAFSCTTVCSPAPAVYSGRVKVSSENGSEASTKMPPASGAG